MDQAIENAHRELWGRFVDPKWNTIRNQADMDGNVVLPTADECRANKPNALSWDISVTDGAMFGGMYMEAAIQRWEITGADEDRDKAHRIADGLMRLASVGQTQGFVARGLPPDGSAHYPGSSNDQTLPWLYGMWRYVRSAVPSDAEREAVRARIIDVVAGLHSHGWRVPCDRPPFDYYGSFAGFDWHCAARLLFILKMAADVSGDAAWEERYRQAATEDNPSGGPNRLETCAAGMVSALDRYHTWTACPGVMGLRGLWDMETDPAFKAAYEQGLGASVDVAAESLPLALEFDNDDRRTFLLDWRELNTLWREQHSVREALDLAYGQLRLLDSLSPRRVYEVQFMREPLFAVWGITICPDAQVVLPHAPAILAAIRHFQYDRLYLSNFFPAELAYYRLIALGLANG